MEFNPWKKEAQPTPIEKMDGKQNYTLESGVTINLSWNKFKAQPQSKEEKEREDKFGKENIVAPRLPGTVVYLPGWAVDSDDASIKQLSTTFAEENDTYAIATRSEQIKQKNEKDENLNILYEEARAISKFIAEQKLKEITIAGHSQGGDKAIDVVSILQTLHPEIKINGLILIDSVGLYKQKPLGLAKDFTKDMLVKTTGGILENDLKKIIGMKKFKSATVNGLRAANDIFKNIFKEVSKTKGKYFDRLGREVEEMSQQNPRMSELRVPVVVISGEKDPVSNPRKIIPFEEEAKIQEDYENRSNQRLEAFTAEERGDWDGKAPVFSRENYLKEHIFNNSPYVKMVVPERLGHHGLPFFRAESVVKNSMHLLKRYKREHDAK